MHSISKYPNSTLEVLLEELQNKLRVNFPSATEAYQFLDVNANQKCRRDHFIFCCQYFQLYHNIHEISELFDLLDTKKDGVLDEAEFNGLFDGMQESWNSHEHNIMDSLLRMNRGQRFIHNLRAGDHFYHINQAQNTFEKLAPRGSDMLCYPYFFHKKQKTKSMFDGQTKSHHPKKRVLSIIDNKAR